MRIRILYIVCAVLLSIGAIKLCFSYYSNHESESALYGNWNKLDSEDGYNGHILTFGYGGEYCNSNIGVWNYKYIEPDSLILYHHGLYEERYKILNLTEDTLTVRLSESIVNLSENGKDIEAPYGDCLKPIYTYIRINHSTIPIE